MFSCLGTKKLGKIDHFSCTFTYEGQLDKDNKACGKGVATSTEGSIKTYSGTFLNDLLEGACKIL